MPVARVSTEMAPARLSLYCTEVCKNKSQSRRINIVETYVEHVFVVGESNDELNNELSLTSGYSTVGHPVGVLPANAVILLVEADDLGSLLCLTSSVYKNAVKVLLYLLACDLLDVNEIVSWQTHLDDAQAVASKVQLVDCMSNATVSKIECLLPVERRSRVGIWDSLHHYVSPGSI
jgi:hypothetical protein